MMAVFVEVFGTFGLTISESKTETMYMPIPRAPATKIVFNAAVQQYRQTTSFAYLRGTMTKTPNLSDEIDRRIRAAWMSSKRYTRKLYDRPKTSLLPLKAWMVRSEVVEALLYVRTTWTPLKGHYTKLRTTHHRMSLRILGAWFKSLTKRVLSYKDALQRTECESTETTVRTKRLLSGALLRMGDHRLPKRVMSGELENVGKRGLGGKEKERADCVADDRRLFGITGDWSTATLDPGVWYGTVREEGCRVTAAWVKEEERASEYRQRKREEAEEADKVEVAPGVTAASLRRFRAALIGPTQGLPKRRRLCQ